MSKLEHWDPDNPQEWQDSGKAIATRNLWISIPNLLCAFSVWLYWGMLAKFIQKLHFADPELFNFTFLHDGKPFEGDAYRALMFNLPAVAGLAGATMGRGDSPCGPSLFRVGLAPAGIRAETGFAPHGGGRSCRTGRDIRPPHIGFLRQ